MAKLWFSFKGVDSREMGVYLVEPLEIPAAERQMRFEEVPGRAGALAIDQGGFLDVDATMEAYMRDGAQMSAVRAWMQGAGELILSVAYEPGWTILVDGKEVQPGLFDDTFISLSLAEGTHTIEMRYLPAGLIIGIIVSLICLAVFASVVLLERRRRRSFPAPETETAAENSPVSGITLSAGDSPAAGTSPDAKGSPTGNKGGIR